MPDIDPDDYPDLLGDVQQDIADRLLADAYFQDVPVIVQNIGDIQNKIDLAIGQIGTCVLVTTPSADCGHPNVPGPYFDAIDFVCTVFENVVINRATSGTGLPALKTAQRIALLLHLYTPSNTKECLRAAKGTISLGANPTMLSYNVKFRTGGGLVSDIDRVETPVATDEGTHLLNLACATAGAAIFFTQDGSLPQPTTGTFYTGPVQLTEAKTIRARAYLRGFLDSAESKTTI